MSFVSISMAWAAALFLEAQVDCFRLLCLVRMLAAGVELELGDHLEGELVLRQHPPHGLAEDQLRTAGLAPGGRLHPQPRIARVPRILLLLPFVRVAEDDLLHVDDDDEIAGIDVRGIRGPVLAHEDHGDVACQPADHLVGGIDQPPIALDFARLGHVRLCYFHPSSLPGKPVIYLLRGRLARHTARVFGNWTSENWEFNVPSPSGRG